MAWLGKNLSGKAYSCVEWQRRNRIKCRIVMALCKQVEFGNGSLFQSSASVRTSAVLRNQVKPFNGEVSWSNHEYGKIL